MSQELVDVYDKNKQKTGKIKVRDSKVFEDGEYALAAKAIIIKTDEKIILSKRSESKKRKQDFGKLMVEFV